MVDWLDGRPYCGVLFLRVRTAELFLACQPNEEKGTNLLIFIKMEILDSIVASIPACHAGDPGSIPGRGVLLPWSDAER